MTKYSFTANTMTCNGATFPVQYSIVPSGSVFVFVTVADTSTEKVPRIRFDEGQPYYKAARAAAIKAGCNAWRNGKREDAQQPAEEERPENIPAAVTEERPENIPAPAAQEQPARDPKQARGPIPDKHFIGTEIKGRGWRILFDGDNQRTRIIFKNMPSKAVRELVQNAGFYWSPSLQSWNKKLTFKAYRAAQDLSAQLRAVCA